MGNQISCELGPAFIEITIKLSGTPFEYPNSKSSYNASDNSTFYYLHYSRSNFEQFKSHELFARIEKNEIPVQVTGVTYDTFFTQLSDIFGFKFIKASGVNHTVESLDFMWNNDRSKFYQCEMLKGHPADGSISTKEEDFCNVPADISSLYPYVLVNIKSGVSIVAARSPTEYEKIGGSCLGISTIWALLRNEGIESLDQLVEEASHGNSSNVDMTVGDIYGGRYAMLPEKLTASTFGKLKDNVQCKREDLAKSLLFMLIFNLGQIAALNCVNIGITQVIVVGSIFTNNFVARLLRFSWDYHSKNTLKLILCENSQFLRSMGVILHNEKKIRERLNS